MVACICTGFTTATEIRIKGRKGSTKILGLGFTNEQRDVADNCWVHSDNILGDPASLSDARIKENVTGLDPSNCLNFCNTLQPSMYLRTDTNKIRTGLVAQDVQAALQANSMPECPVINSKLANLDGENDAEMLMTLSYERLVPMLLGAVKQLTTRITQLESQLQ